MFEVRAEQSGIFKYTIVLGAPPLRTNKFFWKRFSLCGATYPYLAEPLPPRHPWGPRSSSAR